MILHSPNIHTPCFARWSVFRVSALCLGSFALVWFSDVCSWKLLGHLWFYISWRWAPPHLQPVRLVCAAWCTSLQKAPTLHRDRIGPLACQSCRQQLLRWGQVAMLLWASAFQTDFAHCIITDIDSAVLIKTKNDRGLNQTEVDLFLP